MNQVRLWEKALGANYNVLLRAFAIFALRTGRVGTFIMLTLPIHEYSMPLNLYRSSLISFISIVQLSVYKSCTILLDSQLCFPLSFWSNFKRYYILNFGSYVYCQYIEMQLNFVYLFCILYLAEHIFQFWECFCIAFGTFYMDNPLTCK